MKPAANRQPAFAFLVSLRISAHLVVERGECVVGRYLDKAKKIAELTPPGDEGVCSLWVGGLTPQITKQVRRSYPCKEGASILPM